jgi:hypothetical protein
MRKYKKTGSGKWIYWRFLCNSPPISLELGMMIIVIVMHESVQRIIIKVSLNLALSRYSVQFKQVR